MLCANPGKQLSPSQPRTHFTWLDSEENWNGKNEQMFGLSLIDKEKV